VEEGQRGRENESTHAERRENTVGRFVESNEAVIECDSDGDFAAICDSSALFSTDAAGDADVAGSTRTSNMTSRRNQRKNRRMDSRRVNDSDGVGGNDFQSRSSECTETYGSSKTVTHSSPSDFAFIVSYLTSYS
jgi:hypothetical protein